MTNHCEDCEHCKRLWLAHALWEERLRIDFSTPAERLAATSTIVNRLGVEDEFVKLEC